MRRDEGLVVEFKVFHVGLVGGIGTVLGVCQ
jgi:hypothetical protein